MECVITKCISDIQISAKICTDLHEINGRQAKLFEEKAIAHLDTFGNTEDVLADAQLRVEAKKIGVELQRLFSQCDFSGEPNSTFDEAQHYVESQGCFLIYILFYSDVEDISLIDYIEAQHENNSDVKIDTEILCSIGLLERHSITIGNGSYFFEASYYSVNELGVKFFKMVDVRFFRRSGKVL